MKRALIIILILSFLLLNVACGQKAPPKAPEEAIPLKNFMKIFLTRLI